MLTELLLALALTAVLAAITVPAFRDFERRTVISEAQLFLQRLALQQEKHRLLNGGYAEHLGSLPTVSAASDVFDVYTMAIALGPSENRFEVTLTPLPTNPLGLTQSVSLDSSGVGKPASLWRR